MNGLQISDMMPFGRYRGWPLANIPPAYMVEIYGSQAFRLETHPQILEFIEQNYKHLFPVPATPIYAKPLQPLCESLKICYLNEQAANKALERINHSKRYKRKPIRSYPCEFCGFWHHTTKPLNPSLLITNIALLQLTPEQEQKLIQVVIRSQAHSNIQFKVISALDEQVIIGATQSWHPSRQYYTQKELINHTKKLFKKILDDKIIHCHAVPYNNLPC